MAVIGISSRGERVDFDVLAIRQQLASKPVIVGVNERRTFIDIKDGIKPKEVIQEIRNALVQIPVHSPELSEMLSTPVETDKK